MYLRLNADVTNIKSTHKRISNIINDFPLASAKVCAIEVTGNEGYIFIEIEVEAGNNSPQSEESLFLVSELFSVFYGSSLTYCQKPAISSMETFALIQKTGVEINA